MTRDYYLRHRKQILARMRVYNAKIRTRAWYKACWKQKGRAKYFRDKAAGKLWHQKNYKRHLANCKEWQKKHPIKRKRIALAYYYRNKKQVRERQKARYWKNVEAERKRGRDEARRWHKQHPIKARRKSRQAYWKNPERYRLAACWWHYKRRWGIKSNEGKETFKWLRKLRKEHDAINRQRSEGAISAKEQRQRLRQLVLKLQPKSSTKTRRA